MLLNKKLLIVSSGFPNDDNKFNNGIFVKEQLKYVKEYFKEVIVIFPVARSFSVKKEDKYCKNYNYDNVKVFFPRFWHFPIPSFRKKYADNQFKAISKLITKENINFDLVHAHFTWTAGYIGVLLKQKYSKPLILTVHENSDWLKKEVASNDEKLNSVWRMADFIIRVNKLDIPLLKKYNPNVVNIPNGFDHKKFYPINKLNAREKLKLPKDKIIFLTIGALIERKGHKYLINAIPMILKKRKDILFLFAGSGELKDSIKKDIKAQGLDKYVSLLGFVPNEDINDFINACDFFILPSLSEGNPTVMFEALGCGKPFIGTVVGGTQEIIVNQKLGLLLKPKDQDDLANKILIAINKSFDEKEILNHAKKFTWKNIASQIKNKYEVVLK